MSLPITFTGRNVEVTDALRTYVEEKLQKVANIELVTHVDVEIGKTVFHKGVVNDFYVRLLITLPKAVVRIKKEGADVYVMVDEMLPSLHKKMEQYKNNFRKWEGSESWPETALVEDLAVVAQDESASAIYAGYTPNIRKKVVSELSPMSVSEAIERMELLDKDFFVFKDVQSNNIAVVAKKGNDYEMVIAE